MSFTYNDYTFSLDQSLRRLTEYYERPSVACCQYPTWLEKITYKPNWRMAIICEQPLWRAQPNEHRFIVVAAVTDAYHPERETLVAFNHFIHGGADREEFVRCIRRQLLNCERHEFDEFFRVNGVQFHNPH